MGYLTCSLVGLNVTHLHFLKLLFCLDIVKPSTSQLRNLNLLAKAKCFHFISCYLIPSVFLVKDGSFLFYAHTQSVSFISFILLVYSFS